MKRILLHRSHAMARGFTLLEISIVVVIIGLIMGGITVGIFVQQSAKLQSVIADQSLIVEAITSYREKYSALPGDHSTAESVFGSSATDNGDDDGNIEKPDVNNESWLAWQHLALAGLWKGSFTGDNGASATNTAWDAVLGSNVPKSAVDGVGYSIYYPPATDNNFGATPQKHFVVVGNDSHTDNITTFGGWLSTTDAMSIDGKMDDTLAYSGNVRTYVADANKGTTDCTTGAAPSHVYNMASSTALCNIMFMFDPY